MRRLAVFASGTGSNFDAIAAEIERGAVQAEISLVVCDRPGARVIEKAEAQGIETFVFSAKDYPDKAAYENELLTACREKGIEWLILAGYMRLIGPTLLEAYENRIVNIHPSLLPAFPGKDAIGQAFDKRVKVTGVTVHFVDAGMDTGPIIDQEAVRIDENDTRETLQKKIQAVEHRLYPAVIKELIAEEVVQ
ncbi:phosphoribosylglycinamide formyltransferase [Thalassobacillus hwangdonensis]|uniref:Phosphoribosylglycinamide formyltransferase n=1 Tax=Thalassobacillus hwangdonensis TaxID=546108 RepID=A0ABW3L6A4_9BACI